MHVLEMLDRMFNRYYYPTEDELFEMSGLRPKTTGLNFVVAFYSDRKGKHSRPRGKVPVGDKEYPFSIDEPVQWLAKPAPGMTAHDFRQLQAFVRLNREAILALWQSVLDGKEFGAAIVPLT
jgi:hypothetical protein